MWESVKNCSSVCKEAGTRGWTSLVARGCKPPNWSTRVKHVRSWSIVPAVHYRTKVLDWPGCLLATWPRDWVESHPTIYIPLYPWFRESFLREFCERNPRENKIDSSTIFTQEILQIPLLSSSPLSNPWEAHYQNLFSPYPFLWEGCLVF